MLRTILVGGLLPVLVFTVVESMYGTKGGLIAGVLFGAGELTYEYVRYKKVQWITIIGNALVILLGSLALFEENATLFKLQPAILVFTMAAVLVGSSMIKRPLANARSSSHCSAETGRYEFTNRTLFFVSGNTIRSCCIRMEYGRLGLS